MRLSASAVALVLVLAAGPAGAQTNGGGNAGISLTPTVDCTYIFAHDLAGRHWLRALILWRAPLQSDRSTPESDAQRRESRRQYRSAAAAAEDSGRTFAGGWGAGMLRDASFDALQLYVAGRRFDLPLDDSAIVVVVDLPGAPDRPAQLPPATYVPAVLPEEFWPASQYRGDTLLIYHAPPERAAGLLLAHLRANPALRDVLR